MSEAQQIACAGCGSVKEWTPKNFPRESYGLRRKCKDCRAAGKRDARRTRETPDQRDTRLYKALEYQSKNADTIAVQKQAYRDATAVQRKAYDKARYAERAEEYKARASKWRRSNPERKQENNRRWAIAHPGAALNSSRKCKRRRRQAAHVRVFEAVSAQIRIALNGGKAGQKWERLVGYTRAALIAHLERQFVSGMSWTNYGAWHVDHIVPAASFVFTSATDPEFVACWALTNLRPLWAPDNISKGARRTHLI